MAARRPLAVLLSLLSLVSGAFGAREVRVALFMETLCPYCANATINDVAPIVNHPVLGQVVTLQYVPWGNAKLVAPKGAPPTPTPTPTTTALSDDPAASEIRCQHGPVECSLNTLLSCSIALYPPTWFQFALCLEQTVLAKGSLTTAAVAKKCAPATAPPQSAARLVGCAEGALGLALTRMAGERTAALAPRHAYVPWFVVNGVPLRSAADNLLAFVCVALDPGRRALAADVCRDPVAEEDGGADDKAGHEAVGGTGGSGSATAGGRTSGGGAASERPLRRIGEGLGGSGEATVVAVQ